jgi:hypothetical protein
MVIWNGIMHLEYLFIFGLDFHWIGLMMLDVLSLVESWVAETTAQLQDLD